MELQARIAETFSELARTSRAPMPVAIEDLTSDLRDQNRNHDAIAATVALLGIWGDIAPFTLAPALTNRFDLQTDYCIDPLPLLSDNSPKLVQRAVEDLLGHPVALNRVTADKFLGNIEAIRVAELFGKRTVDKLALVDNRLRTFGLGSASLRKGSLAEHVQAIPPESTAEVLAALYDEVLEQARRQRDRLVAERVPAERVETLEHHAQLLQREFVAAQTEAWRTRYPIAMTAQHFYLAFGDRIAQLLASQRFTPREEEAARLGGLRYRIGKGIEVGFMLRNPNFLTSGDTFGDCTARNLRSQTDPETANIHWTVYPWLLDPFYRVLEVTLDGRCALKAHLLPLIIHNRRVLMVDALEAVPSLRLFLRGRANSHRSPRLLARRHELLQAAFSKCLEIASAMGVDAVYVDKFSNADWLRDEIDRLGPDAYDVRDVVKPYGDDVLRWTVRHVLGREPADEIFEEVQAANLFLIHQGLAAGWKEVGVLAGRRPDWSLPLGGI